MMSIDIDLVINTGLSEAVVVGVGNMTHNVQPMWRKAIKETSNRDMNLCDFDGWLAEKAVSILGSALQHMLENKQSYLPLNPSNGWGSYQTAVEYLENFYKQCCEHPRCIIRTDC